MILGIDPGKKGAAVLLDGRRVVEAVRMTDLLGGAKWQAGYAGVTGWLRSVHAEHRVQLGVLELFAGRPGEGGGSAMTTGVGWGLWLGAVAALEIPVRTPSAAAWTRDLFVGVAGEGKERAVALCRAELPGLELVQPRCRVPHDGLADAGCLALWGATLRR